MGNGQHEQTDDRISEVQKHITEERFEVLSFIAKAVFLVLFLGFIFLAISPGEIAYNRFKELEKFELKILVLIWIVVLFILAGLAFCIIKEVIPLRFKGYSATASDKKRSRYGKLFAGIYFCIIWLVFSGWYITKSNSLDNCDIVIAQFDQTVELPFNLSTEGFSSPEATLDTGDYITWFVKRWIVQFGFLGEDSLPKKIHVTRSNRIITNHDEAQSILNETGATSIIWGFDYISLDEKNYIYPLISYKNNLYPGGLEDKWKQAVLHAVPMIDISDGIPELSIWALLAVINAYLDNYFDTFRYSPQYGDYFESYLRGDRPIPASIVLKHSVGPTEAKAIERQLSVFINDTKYYVFPQTRPDRPPDESDEKSAYSKPMTKSMRFHYQCLLEKLAFAYLIFCRLHMIESDSAISDTLMNTIATSENVTPEFLLHDGVFDYHNLIAVPGPNFNDWQNLFNRFDRILRLNPYGLKTMNYWARSMMRTRSPNFTRIDSIYYECMQQARQYNESAPLLIDLNEGYSRAVLGLATINPDPPDSAALYRFRRLTSEFTDSNAVFKSLIDSIHTSSNAFIVKGWTDFKMGRIEESAENFLHALLAAHRTGDSLTSYHSYRRFVRIVVDRASFLRRQQGLDPFTKDFLYTQLDRVVN